MLYAPTLSVARQVALRVVPCATIGMPVHPTIGVPLAVKLTLPPATGGDAVTVATSATAGPAVDVLDPLVSLVLVGLSVGAVTACDNGALDDPVLPASPP